MKLRRVLRGLALAGGLLLLLIAGPVIGVETVCHSPRPADAAGAARESAVPPDKRLPLTNSVLSYPEWYIVYAYQDFANVLQGADEAAFPYIGSISDYWSGLCAVTRVASSQGDGDLGEKVMLYVIGYSFTLELGFKGAYETTVGRLFAWLRGPEKAAEDRFAASMAADYVRFLDQQPWYEYSFRTQVRRLAEIPYGRPLSRALERRVALTLEWDSKAVYAKAIGALASLDPAVLELQSVMRDVGPSDLAAAPGASILKDLGNGLSLVVTPRYGAFTQLLSTLAEHGRQVLDIAGNQTILLTALAPPATDISFQGTSAIFSSPVRSRPGWHRVGILVSVPLLTQTIRGLRERGATLEHVYDY